jgi:hypothetical protein
VTNHGAKRSDSRPLWTTGVGGATPRLRVKVRLSHRATDEEALEVAVADGALAMTTTGDTSLVTPELARVDCGGTS